MRVANSTEFLQDSFIVDCPVPSDMMVQGKEGLRCSHTYVSYLYLQRLSLAVEPQETPT